MRPKQTERPNRTNKQTKNKQTRKVYTQGMVTVRNKHTFAPTPSHRRRSEQRVRRRRRSDSQCGGIEADNTRARQCPPQPAPPPANARARRACGSYRRSKFKKCLTNAKFEFRKKNIHPTARPRSAVSLLSRPLHLGVFSIGTPRRPAVAASRSRRPRPAGRAAACAR
ncbi:hypothetical protein EVAR_18325_1 [Eumeta japonica]|uniref:Uncharacterized protein n=1 Tax=Eumeta variegata TaxID=151549 RepID=A0A4C1V9I3_EUMVA|nr:hypothetical protein EVAR_18325_1 [Eumeta japonica]